MKPADWDDRYREKPLLWSVEPNRFVAGELATLEPGTALDLACGEGRNAIWLAEKGWEVTAVDFSGVALQRGQDMAAASGLDIDWIEADIMNWEPDSRYDLIVMAYVHLPAPDRRKLLGRAAAWVAPGGHLFMVGHDVITAGVSGPPDPNVLWDPGFAAAAVEPLVVDTSERRERPTDSGETAVDTVLKAHLPRS